jgi:hypothetical protein
VAERGHQSPREVLADGGLEARPRRLLRLENAAVGEEKPLSAAHPVHDGGHGSNIGPAAARTNPSCEGWSYSSERRRASNDAP